MIKRIFLSAMLALCGIIATEAENRLYFTDFSIEPGETKEVFIYLDHDVDMCNWQADLYLPEGLSVATNTKGKYMLSIVEDRVDDHQLQSALQTDGAIRMIGVSLTNATYYGVSGDALVSCTLVASDTFTGTHTIWLKNIVLNDPAATRYAVEDTSATINGTQVGVEETLAEEAEAEYYDLLGVKVENPSNGVFIKKQGSKTTKVVL